VIASSSLVGLELCYALKTGLGLASAAGIVFFTVVLATGLLFSTKVGTRGKMTSEFNGRALQPRYSARAAASD
jgi:hypothetical protein